MRTTLLARVALVGLVSISSAGSADARGFRPVAPHHPSVAVVPAVPETVPVGASELVGTLRRMRIYVFLAPADSAAFGAGSLGEGQRLWFLLPSCRASSSDDPHDRCVIDHLQVDALRGGSVRVGAVQTVMAGDIPRRVQAVVVPPRYDLLRIRLLTPAGATRYEAVVRADQLRDLEAPAGRATADGFAFEFDRYPAH